MVGKAHELVAGAIGKFRQYYEIHDAGIQLVQHLARGAAIHVVFQLWAAFAQPSYFPSKVLYLVGLGQAEVQHASDDVVQLGKLGFHLVGHGN